MAGTNHRVLDPIAREIWDMKYRFKQPGGTPIDETIEETWRRVASAVAEAEEPPAEEMGGAFYDLVAGYRFLPAGRILSGAGTPAQRDALQLLRHGPLDDFAARHLRWAEGSRSHHAAGRRHRP